MPRLRNEKIIIESLATIRDMVDTIKTIVNTACLSHERQKVKPRYGCMLGDESDNTVDSFVDDGNDGNDEIIKNDELIKNDGNDELIKNDGNDVPEKNGIATPLSNDEKLENILDIFIKENDDITHECDKSRAIVRPNTISGQPAIDCSVGAPLGIGNIIGQPNESAGQYSNINTTGSADEMQCNMYDFGLENESIRDHAKSRIKMVDEIYETRRKVYFRRKKLCFIHGVTQLAHDTNANSTEQETVNGTQEVSSKDFLVRVEAFINEWNTIYSSLDYEGDITSEEYDNVDEMILNSAYIDLDGYVSREKMEHTHDNSEIEGIPEEDFNCRIIAWSRYLMNKQRYEEDDYEKIKKLFLAHITITDVDFDVQNKKYQIIKEKAKTQIRY